MIWNTSKIIEELQILVGPTMLVSKGTSGPDGDYDTTPLYIEPVIELNPYDAVCISGMDPAQTMTTDSENPVHNIPYVEIRNIKSDSTGGLGHRAHTTIRSLYFIACDYFNKLDVEVIRHHDEVF